MMYSIANLIRDAAFKDIAEQAWSRMDTVKFMEHIKNRIQTAVTEHNEYLIREIIKGVKEATNGMVEVVKDAKGYQVQTTSSTPNRNDPQKPVTPIQKRRPTMLTVQRVDYV